MTTISVELSDAVLDRLEEQAQDRHVTVEQMAANVIEANVHSPLPFKEDADWLSFVGHLKLRAAHAPKPAPAAQSLAALLSGKRDYETVDVSTMETEWPIFEAALKRQSIENDRAEGRNV